MFKTDLEDVKQYESDLKTFARQAFPFATKATVNSAAFATRSQYQSNMRDDLILRNRWTERSVRVEKATTLNVSRQEAIVGSLADYMADQEFGATVHGSSKHQPIATNYAAGQGMSNAPRTRLPRRPNQLKSIQLKRASRGAKSRVANTVATVRAAAANGDKFVYLDLGRRKGIFRVLGGKRKPYIRMVWDLTRRSVHVRANPMLLPATRTVQRTIPQLYRDALLFQLRRAGVFGY